MWKFWVWFWSDNISKDKLEIDRIIIVSWGININTEYKRKAILARDIKSLSLTQVREQAISLSLFDGKKYNSFIKNDLLVKVDEKKEIVEVKENDENTQTEDFVEVLEEKTEILVLGTQEEKLEKYVIIIPKTAKKEDLLELKNFMIHLTPWATKIFLNLNGQEIDTKMALSDISELRNWEKVNL